MKRDILLSEIGNNLNTLRIKMNVDNDSNIHIFVINDIFYGLFDYINDNIGTVYSSIKQGLET